MGPNSLVTPLLKPGTCQKTAYVTRKTISFCTPCTMVSCTVFQPEQLQLFLALAATCLAAGRRRRLAQW